MESGETQTAGRGIARPVIGLDVDGVIALEAPPRVAVDERRVSAWGRWSRTILIPTDAPAVVSLLASEAEIVWVSAWGHNAHGALHDALGLPDEPWWFLPVQFGKAAAVAAYARGRPWALVHDGLDDAAADARLGTVVTVDPRRGIGGLDVAALMAGLGQSLQVPREENHDGD